MSSSGPSTRFVIIAVEFWCWLVFFLMGEKTASHCTVDRFLFAWEIENIDIKENFLHPTYPKLRQHTTGTDREELLLVTKGFETLPCFILAAVRRRCERSNAAQM